MMFIKRCCIKNCKSSVSRSEDVGVTFHRFPKNVKLRKSWVVVTHHNHCIDIPAYVCSRHFCKNDFQVYQDSKYVLKTDSVPSIFPWAQSGMADTEMDIAKELEDNNANTSSSSKESEENVDVIRKFMEQQDKEIEEQKQKNKDNETQGVLETKIDIIHQQQPIEVATSVLDMLLSESETKVATNKEMKTLPKQTVPTGDRGSVALSVGSKVEARDYGDIWYPAEILEVDCDEMEVLVHYDSVANKLDEWISVSSSRLRPIGAMSIPTSPPIQNTPVSHTTGKTTIKEAMPDEKDKPVPSFVVGERCLARWRDSRRFVATISSVLNDGSYEILFDDGFTWNCTSSRLYKLKNPGKVLDSLSIDTSAHPASSTPSPILAGVGPSSAVNPVSTTPFHTHLFDPTRDYLGSKTERREMKRKINIKEIFNIGQKKRKSSVSPRQKTVRIVKERKKKRNYRRKIKQEPDETAMKTEIPEAVASIIGTVKENDPLDIKSGMETNTMDKVKENYQSKNEADVTGIKPDGPEQDSSDSSDTQITDNNVSMETASEEEIKLVKFEKPDEVKHEEVIDKIKEAINKLEGGLEENKKIDSPKPEVKDEILKEETLKDEIMEKEIVKDETVKDENVKEETIKHVVTGKAVNEESPMHCSKDEIDTEKPKKKLSKIKKSKKLRLLQEKKVKKQVEKVKNELQNMKRQIEEMRKQMLRKTEELEAKNQEMPESFLLPGEWCCKWVNGQPVGTVSELESEPHLDGSNKLGLPRRSVQLFRQKSWESILIKFFHGIRKLENFASNCSLLWLIRRLSNVLGIPTKIALAQMLMLHILDYADVEDKRLPDGWTKHMVRRSLGQSAGKWDVVLVGPDNRRFHTKTDMRNFIETQGESLKKYEYALQDFGVHLKLARRMGWFKKTGEETPPPTGVINSLSPLVKKKGFNIKKTDRKEKKRRYKMSPKSLTKDGAEGSDKSLVNTTESTDMSFDNTQLEDGYMYVGSLKVQVIDNLLRCPAEGCFKSFRNSTLIKMHIKYYHRDLRKMLGATPKVLDLAYARTKPTGKDNKKRRHGTMAKSIKVKLPKLKRIEEPKPEVEVERPIESTAKPKPPRLIPRSLDSPKLRQVLVNMPVKRPKVLLPVRRPEQEPDGTEETIVEFDDVKITIPDIPHALDFEEAITTHTVTKPYGDFKSKDKKKSLKMDDDEWFGMNSDFDTRSSCPGSGSPDSKTMEKPAKDEAAAYDLNVEQKTPNTYMYTENGERVKIEQMKREEIINCHCGYREEDGLMVQCELCLCWQHALCHNIHKEAEVPEKYTCSICLNPKRGRRSMRFLHDQDRLYEGLLPGAKPCESLRRSHELSGNLLRIQDALHALRVKYYVTTKKNHPKLYLWAKDWENAEITMTQEKLNSDYSDLNIIINNIGKENLPVKADDMRDLHLDLRTLPDDEHKDSLMSITTALSSPGGTSLDLPISTSDLERLAKTVQEQESPRPAMIIPQPEAAIDNAVCRERLLRHLQRCQALIDARLDSIEAQVAELESQDPSFEDDETADYFPRTKQTIQMLMRDLDTMEELGIIT